MLALPDLDVAIVGGGLVGALEACMLSQRGFRVTLFEGRHDGRNEPSYYGRSINLAISHRGISALKRLNLDYIVQERAIPMKARMIHNRNGKSSPIPYDPDGRCINSIERAGLNNFLLDKAEKQFKVKILFNHRLVEMNADLGELVFRIVDDSQTTTTTTTEKQDGNGDNGSKFAEAVQSQLVKYNFDLILGCDGARSAVRGQLARATQLELSQSYIEHGYLELRIDRKEDGSFKMPPNYLHIWPRGQYMMIALPNKDASFTCTLFMPFEQLEKLKEPGAGLEFFQQNFPDSIELIGPKEIERVLSAVRASSLISVKCKPYHYKDKVALLGDSAHAMVPFYGQGMNCGFEDCLVFDELLDKHLGCVQAKSKSPGPSNGAPDAPSLTNGANKDPVASRQQLSQLVGKVLEDYSAIRCINGHSMCELAMYNYIEMRDLVNTWSFRARKHLDNQLYRLFPNKWVPLYTMVTFSRLPVNECVSRRQLQDKILNRLLGFAGFVLIFGLGSLGALKLASRR